MVGSSDPAAFFLGVRRQFRNAGERERATGGVMANDAEVSSMLLLCVVDIPVV